MRTGIFGGTFDPIHMAHLTIAETLKSDFPLDRILFIPAFNPPHKERVVGCPEDRFRMVQLAIQDNPNFFISDIELERGSISYTIDTISLLNQSEKWCNDEFFLIIGADSLIEIETWKQPEQILNRLTTLVIERPGFDIQELNEKYRQKVILVPAPFIDISSSTIRKRIHENKSIRYWIHEKVEAYIHENGLYR